jgi:hypothetical protein
MSTQYREGGTDNEGNPDAQSGAQTMMADSGTHTPGIAAAGGKAVLLLVGICLGAGLMYLLDPDRGRRRRALLRDKFVGLSNDVGDAVSKTARDLRNRAQGVVAETSKALGINAPNSEEQPEQARAAER